MNKLYNDDGNMWSDEARKTGREFSGLISGLIEKEIENWSFTDLYYIMMQTLDEELILRKRKNRIKKLEKGNKAK